MFGGALAAMLGRRLLPEHHLSADSRDVVKVGMGLIATLTALVLGLLIATAKGTYDAQSSAVKELSANVLLLDRILAKYGPETKEARALLREGAEATLAHLWPAGGRGPTNLAPGEARAVLEAMYDKVAALSPKDDARRALKTRALDTTADLARGRMRLFVGQDNSLPLPFLVVLVFWLTLLFVGYGLLAPGNATLVGVLMVCTLSVAGAVFLLLELARPFTGIMRVSSDPLRDVLTILGK